MLDNIKNKFCTTAHRTSISHEENANNDATSTIEFNLRPELLRFMAYFFFWTMCVFAILITRYAVAPILLAGPQDGKSCPPFETGEGFDIYTDSHLMRAFGFNNVS